MSIRQEIRQLPNLVSLLRILIAPLLFVFAFLQMEYWFLGALIFSGLTDVVDGFLARKMNQITSLGARLDSWGDFTIYSTMAICAWILWPDVTEAELVHYAMILFSLLLPAWIGLVKFGKITGYHTWSVKVAVLSTFVGYISLYTGLADWPFALAAWLSVIAGGEEILITLLLRHERTDVRSVFAAWRLRRQDRT